MAKNDTNRFGHFQLTRKLGEGSTGEVYLAKNSISNDQVALKIFRDEVVEAIGPARLKQQYLLMAQLKDPRVVPVLETGICERKLWITMPPLSEGTLEDAISAVPPEEACRIIAQIASGLEFIHARGILHLDLKPGNIFRCGKGLMLADFGLKSEIPGKISGTPAYIAPEIIRGEHHDFRADLYSLGIVALELLTGQNPFICRSQTETLQKQLEFEPQIPRMGKRFDPFRRLLEALLDKAPSKRPPSAYSVRMEIQRILGEEGVVEEKFFLPEGPFVGRESEIAAILENWDNIDSPKILSVRGSHGVGKTAFCERAQIELERKGAKTALLKREKGAIAKLFAPYFQKEYFKILRECLPALSCVADFPQSLLDELEIEPSKPPQSEAETLFLVVSALEAMTVKEPLFAAIFTTELNPLWKAISESRTRIFTLIDDGETEDSIILGDIDETSLKAYVHGIYGDIEAGNELVEKLFQEAKGNFAQTRQKLLNYGISGALVPETYRWRFKPEISDAEIGVEKLWPSLDPAETIFATAVALENAVDFDLAEKLLGGSSVKAAYSLIAKGLIREQSDKETIVYTPSRELKKTIGELIPAKTVERTKMRIAKAYLELESAPENSYRAAVNYIEANQPQKAYMPLFEAGNSFMKKLKYANAAEAFERALQIDSHSPDLKTSIKTAKRLGLSRKYLGDFESAREAYYRAMAMAEQAGDEDQKASILSDIGVTFFEGGDPQKAISFYDRAMEIHKSRDNEKGYLFDLVNKAGAHQTMKIYPMARKEYICAIPIAEKLGNSLAQSVINLNLGEMDIAEGDFSGALPRVLTAAKIAQEKEIGQILFRSLLSLARIYRRQGRRKLAEKAIEEAEEISVALGKRSSGAVLIEKAALQRVCGEISSATSSISTALAYCKLFDKEEKTELAIEYAQISSLGQNLPPFPTESRIYDEMRPALEFSELILKSAPCEGDFANLLQTTAKAFDYEQEGLGVTMLTYAIDYFMKKGDLENASSLMDWVKAKLLSSDPYIRGILAYSRAQIYITKGEIPAARHSLSAAISAFKELENDVLLAKTETLKTLLEQPQKQEETGLARLLPIIKAMNSTLETNALIAKILSATIDLTGAERGIFFVVENDGAEPLLAISADGNTIDKSDIKYSHSLTEEVIINNKAAFSEDIREDNALSSKSSIIDLELTMALCVPVSDAENRVQGLIYADSQIGKGMFDKSVLDIISALADQSAVALRNAERFDALRFEKDRLSRDYSERFGATILGSSRAIADLKRRLAVIAPKDISALITGETGTGKELVAKTIHDGSSRRNKPFIAVNCAALPETLLESELFGHEKGAFTGADSRHIGRFEQAEGGTIFLDEISEMPIGLQAKLLRVLETCKVSRLGGSGEIEIDVRLLTATNREPEEAISDGVLRSDLYYRIAGMQIAVPPLRERKEDIPELIAHFIAEADRKFGRDVESISRTALSQMTAYPWFGNVRELISVVEEAVLFAPGKMLRPEDLPSKLQKAVAEGIVVADLPRTWADFLRRKSDLVSSMEEQVLRGLLEKYDGKIVDAARGFKINRSQLHHLMKKHGIVTKE